MNNLFHLIINPYTAAYLIILIGAQTLYHQWQKRRRDRLTTYRLTRGLPPNSLTDRSTPLKQQRYQALLEVTLFAITLVIVPVLLVGIANLIKGPESTNATHQNGLTLVFLGLLVIAVFGGLQSANAFVGGLAYKAIAAFSTPFQLGDYVTIKGISGKVVQFNTFFTKINTLNGQQISLPSHTLWHEAIASFTHSATSPLRSQATGQMLSRESSAHRLSSHPASSRAADQSLQCEMVFYLSPTIIL